MPRVYDRRPRANDDHNPLKNLLNVTQGLDQVAVGGGNQVNTFITQLFGQNTTFTQDVIDLFSGGNALSDLESWINGLFGGSGSTTIPDSSIPNAVTNISALQSAVGRLQQAGNPGQSVIVDFSALPDSTNLPSSFTQTYSGSGTNPYGVADGAAQEGSGNSQARSTSALYNGFDTDTDTQIVTGVWPGRPIHDGLGNRAYVSLEGRKNSADDTNVYVELAQDSMELGCTVSGSKTVFDTIGNGGSGFFSFTPGALYTLYCGTPFPASPDRVFLVTENGSPMITFTDGSAVSQLGASYRGGGLSARWPSSISNIRPGSLQAWGFADN